MKKEYVKPEIMIENFLPAERIAACDNSSNNADWMEQMNNSFGVFWTDSGCNEAPVEGVDYDGYCYHTSANSVFSS